MTRKRQSLELEALLDEARRVRQMDDQALAAHWLELEDEVAPLVEVPHSVAPHYASRIRRLYSRITAVEDEQARRWREANGIETVPTDGLGRSQ